MLELGEASGPEHRALGEYISKAGVDLLVAYGNFGGDVVEGAGKGVHAKTHADAARAVAEAAREGDVVLVKGSRGMRMEEVTKLLMEGA